MADAQATSRSPVVPIQLLSESSIALLRELVAHLRESRTQLREEWARRITEAQLLTAMSKEEIFAKRPRSMTTTWMCLRPELGRGCKHTPATYLSASFRVGSKPTRSWASRC